MIQDVEVFAGCCRLDIDENTIVALTRQIGDIADVQDRSADFTNKFTIPTNANNLKVLGLVGTVISDTHTPYAKIPYKVIMEGIEVVPNGYGQIDSVKERIAITIFSGNAHFFFLLKDKKLSDLQSLNTRRTQWTLSNILTKRNATSDVFWPMMNLGTQSELNVFMDARDMWPSIYVHSLIDAIFEDAEYNKTGNLLDEPDYKKLIIPFADIKADDDIKEDVQAIRYCDHIAFNQGGGDVDRIPLSFDSSVNAIDPYGLINNTGTSRWSYKVKSSGYYTFKAFVNIRVSSSPTDPSRVIYLRIQDHLENDYAEALIQPSFGLSTWQRTLEGEAWLEAGSDIYVSLSQDYDEDALNCSYIIYGTDDAPTQDPSYLQCLAADIERTAYGWDVPVEINMPDMLQSDFIKDIGNMFACMFQTNPYSRTVDFIMFKELRLNLDKATDWSGKLDVRTEPELSFRIGDYGRKNEMKYAFDDLVPEDTGEGHFLSSDETLDEIKEKINLTLAASNTSKYFNNEVNMANINVLAHNEGHLLTDDDTSKYHANKVNKWVLYNSSEHKGDAVWFFGASDQIGSGRKTDPSLVVGDMASRILSTNLVPTLSDSIRFHAGDRSVYTDISTNIPETYFIGDEDSIGFEQLSEDYYKYLEYILDKCKVIRAYFRLNAQDISDMDFSVPKYIERFSAHFYVNKIAEYSGDLTLVELVKL